MAFTIHRTPLAYYVAAEISQALRQLPLDLPSNLTDEKYSPELTKAIMEDEYAFHDMAANAKRTAPVNFFATKNVGDCLAIYLYNDSGERCLVHHTHQLGPNWESIFKHFKNKNLKMVFWGGLPHQPQGAIENMSRILQALIDYCRQHPEVRIQVVKHRFAAYNAPQKGEMAQVIAHFVQNRFILGFKLHFNQPFARQLNFAKPEQNFVATVAAGKEHVQTACQLVLSDPHRWPKILGKNLTAEFLNSIAAIAFSKQGYEELSTTFEKHKFEYLTNFAINLDNHRVFPCAPPPLPKEPLRMAYLFSKHFQTSKTYREAFNGVTNPQGETILFPEKFIELCRAFAKPDKIRLIESSSEPVPELLQAFNFLQNTGNQEVDWRENMRIQKLLLEILFYYQSCSVEFASSAAQLMKLYQEESLRIASALGLAGKVRQLLAEGKATGLDVNSTDGLERTALHFAVMRHALVLKLLTEHRARFGLPDTHSVDECLKGHVEVIRVLREAQASVDRKNGNGSTPLQLAERDSTSKERTPLEIDIAKQCVHILQAPRIDCAIPPAEIP